MADLTTTDGTRHPFHPQAVAMVTDHDPVTGQAVTCVYGLTPAPLKIAEAPQAFLDRLGMGLSFAILTRGNGSPAWMNAPAVTAIWAPMPGQYVATVKAVITVGPLTQGVEEDPQAARALINARGGNL